MVMEMGMMDGWDDMGEIVMQCGCNRWTRVGMEQHVNPILFSSGKKH